MLRITESTYFPKEVEYKIARKLEQANPYKTKVASAKYGGKPAWWNPLEINTSQGFITAVTIQTFSPGFILKDLKAIPSPLHEDHSVTVNSISFEIRGIHRNDKLLTFDQIYERMVARYGDPTSKSKRINRISNWKTGKYDRHPEYIWEDANVRLTLEIANKNSLQFTLTNKSEKIKQVLEHAYKMTEAHAFILLKKRIAEMAELERKKAAEAKKIAF